jgi:hypothetical protein
VAIAFYWLNLWGQDRFTSLRNALINHPWQLPKKVTYLFDWPATQVATAAVARTIIAVTEKKGRTVLNATNTRGLPRLTYAVIRRSPLHQQWDFHWHGVN